MTIKEGQPAPDFTAPATSDTTITLSALKGKKVVLYFYPKDSTPGCTTEGQNFRDLYPNFQEANCEILGVSKDSLRRHENFKAKQEFPFELISDAYRGRDRDRAINNESLGGYSYTVRPWSEWTANVNSLLAPFRRVR